MKTYKVGIKEKMCFWRYVLVKAANPADAFRVCGIDELDWEKLSITEVK